MKVIIDLDNPFDIKEIMKILIDKGVLKQKISTQSALKDTDSIDFLDLKERTKNILKHNHIWTIGTLRNTRMLDIYKFEGMGLKSITDLKTQTKIHSVGLMNLYGGINED